MAPAEPLGTFNARRPTYKAHRVVGHPERDPATNQPGIPLIVDTGQPGVKLHAFDGNVIVEGPDGLRHVLTAEQFAEQFDPALVIPTSEGIVGGEANVPPPPQESQTPAETPPAPTFPPTE